MILYNILIVFEAIVCFLLIGIVLLQKSTGDGNGLSFPDLEKLAYAYGMRYVKIENSDEIEAKTREALEGSDPVLCEVILSDKQNFEPKLSSKVLPDGSIVSPPIEDMFPFLPREEFEAIAATVPGKD